eukprot:jgi/Chlat1/4905/Chrsp31S04820
MPIHYCVGGGGAGRGAPPTGGGIIHGVGGEEQVPPTYLVERDTNFCFPAMRQVTLKDVMMYPREMEDGDFEALHIQVCNGLMAAVETRMPVKQLELSV